MPLALMRLVGIALSCIATMTPCRADSLASSASSAGSASLGSLSNSIHGSSNSSSRDAPVAEGDYRIVEVAEVAERPGLVRLDLQATARHDSGFLLDLPLQTLAQSGLVRSDIVRVRRRPYGLEFAHADTHVPFFLVLHDDWHRELDPRAVTL
jgi:hypothetical protein